MTTMKRRGLGLASALGTLVTLGVVACGDDFTGDCRASHTCPEGGGAANHEAGSGGADDEQPSAAGGGESMTTAGGAAGGPLGGEGGGAVSGCRGPEDCDNGNLADGAELCGDDGVCLAGNAPPTIISVSPDADASLVELDSAITIEFSEALDPATVTSFNIRVWDGDKAVDAELVHVDGEVTITPTQPWGLLAEYSIQVTTAVADAAGASLLDEHTSTFTTRDGSWLSGGVDAVAGAIDYLAGTLPVTAKGDTLLAWISATPSNVGTTHCPASARWFNAGKALAPVEVFQQGADVFECTNIAVGANAAGVAAVGWQEEYGVELVQQFRDGHWLTAPQKVTTIQDTRYFGIGVAPNGGVAHLQHGLSTSTYARATTTDGVWGAAASVMAPNHKGSSAPQLAFAADSNGFAVWRSEAAGKDEVMVARYTTANGWAAVQVMPGSAASVADKDNERGVPAIAVDDDGGAMAVWVRKAAGTAKLVASRYGSEGWSAPVPISGALVVSDITTAPGLVFDGTNYVAAFVGVDGPSAYSYTALYDIELAEWDAYEQRSAGSVLDRMPALGVDGHGNLLMTWVKLDMSLEYARFNARIGEWSDSDAVSGGLIKDDLSASGRPTPLGVGFNGHGAIMWGDENPQGTVNKIRLASFR